MLPRTWQKTFMSIDPQDLGKILSGTQTNHVLPLSFLSLMKTVNAITIPRESSYKVELNNNFEENGQDTCATHPRLKNLFLKHVKLKKRHEISLMADVVKQTARESSCSSVIDFGSGLGHLVRVLAYKHELYAAGIECQAPLTEEARKLDMELEYTASKHLSPKSMAQLQRPTHFNLTLSTDDQLSTLDLPTTMKEYGLIGLHPCGDLGPFLLRHFINNDEVKFICVVGCCYMKLSTDGQISTDNQQLRGYPLSRFVGRLDNGLSYVSREIACHALEVYSERLRKGQFEDLKIHAYRAALERILVKHNPTLKHSPVRSIKHSNEMTFEEYCSLAIERLSVVLPTSPHVWAQARTDLQHWQRVVTVYTLRLALAPLVETVILLDRVLYVLEHGFPCKIHPVFDPKISPRNHIIIARRLLKQK